ncbi:MAG: LLM class flavin-dependent oxidoreductase [Chloroflexi bacterium]|nr:LLM class flavin-dependent oxidoreductase [Chloroflexota bacterium]
MENSHAPQIGFGLPQVFPEGAIDIRHIQAVSQAAEDLGLHSLWVQEQVLGRANVLEALSLLTYVAAITSSIRLGVAVLVLPQYHPVLLAKQISTLDHLSQGRAIIGIGLGGHSAVLQAARVSEGGRVRRFSESLQVMKQLWTLPATSLDGRFFFLENAAMEPKPIQRPHPPIWFGGRHLNALRRAVRYGAGWMGSGASTLEDFKASANQVKEYLAEARVAPASFTISKRVYLAIDANTSRAEQRLRAWFTHYYGNPELVTRVCIIGDGAFCQHKLQDLVEAGARHLLLSPLFDRLEHLEQLGKILPGLA